MDTQETSVYHILLLAGVVIASVLLYALLSSLRQQLQSRRRFTRKLNAEIQTMESDRKRIARDLHDDLGPVLSAAKMKLQCLEPEDEIGKRNLTDSYRHIESIIDRIRSISYGLMPNALLHKGPVYAIQQFIDQFYDGSGMQIELIHEPIPLMPEQESVHIYRILQEIIQNTHKHAQAANLMIRISICRDKLIVASVDDGIGFPYHQTLSSGKGLGLNNILNRVHLLDGLLHIESKPGMGTRICIEIPTHKNQLNENTLSSN